MRIPSVLWIFVCFCFGIGYAYGVSDGDQTSPQLERQIEVDITKRSAKDALLQLTAPGTLRLVADLLPQANMVTLPKGKHSLRELLIEFTQQTGCRMVTSNEIVVLRPAVYPPASMSEEQYRLTVTGLAELLESMPRLQREAVLREEWLLVSSLRSAQEGLVRRYVGSDVSDEIWQFWLSHHRVTVGFLFDPYVEIEAGTEHPAERIFFRTRSVLPAYNKLNPGRLPESFRPKITIRGKP